MACIYCLPLELIWFIFSFLPRRDLVRLALVNNAFLFMAHPCFFRDKLNIKSSRRDRDFELFWAFASNPRNMWIGARIRHLDFSGLEAVSVWTTANPQAPVFDCDKLSQLLEFCPNVESLSFSSLQCSNSTPLALSVSPKNLCKVVMKDVVPYGRRSNPLVLLSLVPYWMDVQMNNCRWRSFDFSPGNTLPTMSARSMKLTFPTTHSLCGQFVAALPPISALDEVELDSFCAASSDALGRLMENLDGCLRSIKLCIDPLHGVREVDGWCISSLQLAKAVTTVSIRTSLYDRQQLTATQDRADLFLTFAQNLPPVIEVLAITLRTPGHPLGHEERLELVDLVAWCGCISSYPRLHTVKLVIESNENYFRRSSFHHQKVQRIFDILQPLKIKTVLSKKGGETLCILLDPLREKAG